VCVSTVNRPRFEENIAAMHLVISFKLSRCSGCCEVSYEWLLRCLVVLAAFDMHCVSTFSIEPFDQTSILLVVNTTTVEFTLKCAARAMAWHQYNSDCVWPHQPKISIVRKVYKNLLYHVQLLR
jgi:hypothetical protein